FGPVAAAALLMAEPRPVWPPLLAGLAAFLGHLFPVYLGFAGGKGVATAAGVFFALAPTATLAACAVFGAVLAACRFVSLASMSASLALPAVYAVLERDRLAARWPVLLLCSLTAALVVLRHRANLKRLIAGTEPRVGEGKK
ncbi:MAG: glycerol-3-phosphate acyltransferase, partial [Planctomycetes bacterium]|nr:glycerol-3-phosphate acyltransferase [Planctomycetota bacterium]